jgi:predicted O-methyltransferase YrrM
LHGLFGFSHDSFRPGEDYSVLPGRDANRCLGIELQEDAQLELLEKFSRYYKDLPFSETPSTTTRYYYQNAWFKRADATILYSVLRHYNPSTIIEVGSGYSSAIMMDVNDLFLGNKVHLTFIEPDPTRLFSLLGQAEQYALLEKQVQDVPLEMFRNLSSNDILFVDSSHVVKAGSDVAHLLFNVLPELRPGVIVHFHDIPWPFEYPLEWFHRGSAWNEAYFLRGFLQYNQAFEIVYFNSFMTERHTELLQKKMPWCAEFAGTSLWLRKIS